MKNIISWSFAFLVDITISKYQNADRDFSKHEIYLLTLYLMCFRILRRECTLPIKPQRLSLRKKRKSVAADETRLSCPSINNANISQNK